MGEVSQVVFVISEILAQVRGRGIDLDRLSQNKALQDGLTVDKKEAIQHLTKLLVDPMHKNEMKFPVNGIFLFEIQSTYYMLAAAPFWKNIPSAACSFIPVLTIGGHKKLP